jgi:chromosome segregation ATPase
MAEMNELLEQAIEECEGLAAEADSFAAALDGMDLEVSDGERDVLERARANVERMGTALAELKARDGRLDQREQDQRRQLDEVDNVLEEREKEAAAELEKLQQAGRDLLAERDRIAEELRSTEEHGREVLEALRERFQALEQGAADQFERAEEAVQRLEAAVRSAMDAVRESQGHLLEVIDRAAQEGTARMDALVESWEAASERVETAAQALRDGVEQAASDALEALDHAFGERVPAVLHEGCAALGQALAAIAEDAREFAQVDTAELQSCVQNGQQAFQAMSDIVASINDMQAALLEAVR